MESEGASVLEDLDEQERQGDKGDEKTKVSRWQIGSGSLGVLEQVYAMEPFPGGEEALQLAALRALTAGAARALAG